MRVPVAAPGRLHSFLEAGRVLLRQTFQGTGPFAPAYESRELLDIRERPAHGGELPVETGSFDCRFRCPLETSPIAVAPEPELFDEHDTPFEPSLLRAGVRADAGAAGTGIFRTHPAATWVTLGANA